MTAMIAMIAVPPTAAPAIRPMFEDDGEAGEAKVVEGKDEESLSGSTDELTVSEGNDGDGDDDDDGKTGVHSIS